MKDRTGSSIVLNAATRASRSSEFLVRAQRRVYVPHRLRNLRVAIGDVENYWDIYDQGDVLLAPRRYGGQNLPMLEAWSRGMPVIGLAREPELSVLPEQCVIPATVTDHIDTMGGRINVYDADPADLAKKIEQLANEPELYRELAADADQRAEALSWQALGPRWLSTLKTLGDS